jgi:hypothetical protein
MLKAFIDDSGSDENSPLYAVGGFVATVTQAGKLSDEWARWPVELRSHTAQPRLGITPRYAESS